MRILPDEPTPEMVDVGVDRALQYGGVTTDTEIVHIYRAMLAAFPFDEGAAIEKMAHEVSQAYTKATGGAIMRFQDASEIAKAALTALMDGGRGR